MKNETLYNKTVNILVDAYFNDTLMHNACSACAVGNILAASVGAKVIITDEHHRGAWIPQKDIKWYEVLQRGNIVCHDSKIISQMEKSGYTVHQLAKIERAFENASAPNGRKDRDDVWMFNGLMSVIEVLDEIHENNDMSVSESSKKKFVRAEQRTEP